MSSFAGNQQAVFINSRVPDLQDLVEGVDPGTQVFVLDPASDGLEQIADLLAANNLTNLESISIVSHGASGELKLGSSLITDASLGASAPMAAPASQAVPGSYLAPLPAAAVTSPAAPAAAAAAAGGRVVAAAA